MKDHVYAFEKMQVWADARMYVSRIYKITDIFPKSEIYGISSQLQRAAVSVVSNIAEGMCRKTPKDQVRFIEIAYGSLIETYCQLIIALDLIYITEEQFQVLKKDIAKISNKLNALSNTISKRI